MKRKANKKRILPRKPVLLSCGVSILMLLYAWLSQAFNTFQLPDGEHPVFLYSTELQNDLGVVMSEAIDKAQSSVTLVIYNLTDRNIIRSLREKADSGALVKVICDAKNSNGIEKQLGSNVKMLRRYLNDLMHIKMLIIDEKQTWFGSANMTSQSLRHYGNLMMAIESEALAEMASAKARSFTANGRMHQIFHRTFPLGQQSAELWFLPDDPMAISRIKGLIRSAKKCIHIAMFTWTRRDLAGEVIAAKNRGVSVEVVLDHTQAMGAGKQITQMLLENGVHVKLGEASTLLHHKFMVVDYRAFVNGSANWTLAAFDRNDDCFVVLEPLLESQKQFMEETWAIIDHDSSDADL